MSIYTNAQLEEMTLLARPAWHSRPGASNIYPDGVPFAEVQRRLFNFEPVAVPSVYYFQGEPMTVPGKVAWIKSTDGGFLGFHNPTIPLHGFTRLLLQGTQDILGGTMRINSAGCIYEGRVGWVSVGTDEIELREGVRAYPNLLGTSSLDSRIKNIWKMAMTLSVCDNTWNIAVGENAPTYSFKRTRNGDIQVPTAREALGMVERTVDATDLALQALLDDAVPFDRWKRFLDARYPIPARRDMGWTKAGKPREDTIYNNAVKRQQILTGLWRDDYRVAPWAGTAFGVLQADDVFRRYFDRNTEVKLGSDTDAVVERIERNHMDLMTSTIDTETARVTRVLAAV